MAARSRNLAPQCRRVAARRGKKRAAVAVEHTILVIIHHLLASGAIYNDLGANYFDQRDSQAVIRRAMHRPYKQGHVAHVPFSL